MMKCFRLLLIFMMLSLLTGCCGCGCGQFIISSVMLLLTGLLAVIPKLSEEIVSYRPDFYNYSGFRDMDRFPLVYPYHMVMIDTYDCGCLEEYIGGDIEDSYRSSRPVLSGISAIIQREDSLLFKLEKADKEGNHYGIFHYPTKEIRRFKDLDALRGELKPDFPLDFESLEKAYDNYWKSPKQK